jgi:Flp pilus assembly protein TadD
LGWQFLVGWLGLCGLAGCQTGGTLPGVVGQQAAPLDGSRKSEDRELPPEQASRLCLATAQEMEKSGSEGTAISLYEKARLDDPRKEPQICRRLAILYDRQGNFTKALEEYQKSLQLNPHDADLLNDLGYSYYSRGKLDEAEKALRQALACDGKHARAWVNLGMTLGAQGRYAESLEAFCKAVPPAEAHCNLAFLLTTQKKWAEASQEYHAALGLNPNLVLAQASLEKLQRGP